MNTNEMNAGNIFILNFTFNHKLRILQQAEQVIQLRKKEADVLALLCEKHPNPVSQNDFLINVWGGGYVTSQSIAQVIRSLRLSLGDEKKSTISTIPKLGYKLTTAPVYEDVQSVKFQHDDMIKVRHVHDDFSYADQKSVINTVPASTSISIVPYMQMKKNFFSIRKLIFSSVIIIFGSLACVTLSARNISVDNMEGLEQFEQIAQDEHPIIDDRRKNMIEYINGYLNNCSISNDKVIKFLKNKSIYDCFLLDDIKK
ncbi:winged helix-turn-helix domain-containing protein [Citrobacter sp. JGM124]|uniref:winged helix-turn-helix domain-containing protein n=1 Tax=Citrobacter sp. JGM124 TaxID=2799789 RepID=UPI002011BCE9|nr:winged helix-turn-helix domain-containing protein [Citrobacter sp. JGM124]